MVAILTILTRVAGSLWVRLALSAAILAYLASQLDLGATVPALLRISPIHLLAVLAPRMEVGAISPAWGSYVYTSYQQDLLRDRPTGVPRRSRAEVERAGARYGS